MGPFGPCIGAPIQGNQPGLGLELLQRQVVSVTSTTVTFSGLNGNVDRAYYIQGHIKNATNATILYVVQPNGASTNCHGCYEQSNGQATARTSASHMIFGAVTGSTRGAFGGTLVADATPATARMSFCSASNVSVAGSGTTVNMSGGQFNDTTTNITSLGITTVLYATPATTGAWIAPGSWITLYRFRS
jgi:hypothetical protein